MHQKENKAPLLLVILTDGLIDDLDEIEAAIQALLRVLPNIQQMVLLI